jgi:hypothetical protein
VKSLQLRQQYDLGIDSPDKNHFFDYEQVFFSANERYALLVKPNEAAVAEVGPEYITLVRQIDLCPLLETEHQFNEKSKWLGSVSNCGRKVILHHPKHFRVQTSIQNGVETQRHYQAVCFAWQDNLG